MLKHGGHERVLNSDGYLKAPKACELKEEGRWLILKSKGGEAIYPKPDNFVGTGQTKFKAGDLIGTSYNTTSPIYRLNAICAMLRAKGGAGVKYFEKENVIISDCYALNDGKINYKENEWGDIEVTIGDKTYEYNPQCMYFFPQGAEVKKFDRICSGVANMNHVIRLAENNINDIYQVFRLQFYSLMFPQFLKTKVTELSYTQEEIIELLFASLVRIDYDPKTLKADEIEYQGTHNGIMNKQSFYTLLSFGYSSRVVGKAIKGDIGLKGDIMTETILGLLLNNKLDDNSK